MEREGNDPELMNTPEPLKLLTIDQIDNQRLSRIIPVERYVLVDRVKVTALHGHVRISRLSFLAKLKRSQWQGARSRCAPGDARLIRTGRYYTIRLGF